MKKLFTFFLLFFAMLTTQADQTFDTQALVVKDVWVREAPPTAKVLAAYMTLKNPTDHDIILTRAESPAFNGAMFHRTEMSEGIAKMRHVEKIIIPANSSFELKPGGYHIMLMGKKGLLKEGDTVELSLIFKNIEKQEVMAKVIKPVVE